MSYQEKPTDAVQRFLSDLIWTFFSPLFERMNVANRSKVKYKQLRRNRPVDPGQIYDPSRNRAEITEAQIQKIDRWKRNLSRYARMYENARFPLIDPPANEIFRND